MRIDVLEMFAEVQAMGRWIDSRSRREQEGLQQTRKNSTFAMAAKREHRQAARRARAALRPPCPHCGGVVERGGTSAKIPKYCSPKCMRAARWKAWHAKHGAEWNAKRRKTDRRSPTTREQRHAA